MWASAIFSLFLALYPRKNGMYRTPFAAVCIHMKNARDTCATAYISISSFMFSHWMWTKNKLIHKMFVYTFRSSSRWHFCLNVWVSKWVLNTEYVRAVPPFHWNSFIKVIFDHFSNQQQTNKIRFTYVRDFELKRPRDL